MKYIFYITLMSLLLSSCKEPTNSRLVINEVDSSVKTNILEQMEASRQCWNRGDLEGYMQVYWQSDSLLFMGLNSMTGGWQSTLKNYKKGYPTKAHRGVLTYTFQHFNQLAPDCVLVIGSFYLEREVGNAQGNFSLIWKKIDGEWKIIFDHT